MDGVNAGLVLGLAGALSGAIMAALALAMSRAPGWTELRSFALVAFTAAAYCLFALVHVVPLSDRVVMVGDMLTLAASFVYGLVWVRHFAVVSKRPLARWERRTIAVGAVLVVLALVPGVMIVDPIRRFPVEWIGVTYQMASGTVLAFVGVAFTVVVTIVAAFGGRRWSDGWHARLPMLGASALALTGVTDTIGSLEIAPIPQLIEAVTVLVVVAIGASYARRFIEDAHRLEGLSTGLEREVAMRTSELLTAQAVAIEHQRLAGLGRIAAGVAHEINNPTAVIQHNLELLRDLMRDHGQLVPDVATRLDRSLAATKRIADIVRQLLETGRGHASATARADAFAIAPVVDNAIAAASLTPPDLQVTVTLADGLCARGASISLEQALINLLVNAAHATRDAAGGGLVRIEGERNGDRVRLRVVDNGTGISDSIRDRLFEPFSTTKRIGEGSGLGLAVSRGQLARHGGTLELARTSSTGTEMVIELDAADASELGAVAAVAEVAAPGVAAADLHVLVIEDNDDLREVLTLQLDRFFHITEAASVDEALAKIRDRRYDVVLCDVMMPGGGAQSWLSRVAQIDPQLDQRTILLTGGPTNEAASALVQDRAGRVMYKPVDISALKPLIERTARS